MDAESKEVKNPHEKQHTRPGDLEEAQTKWPQEEQNNKSKHSRHKLGLDSSQPSDAEASTNFWINCGTLWETLLEEY